MLITVIFLSALFWQSAVRLSKFAWFLANIEVVKTELCEQREVVDNCCKGKCYLAKEMKEAEAPRESNATTIAFSELIFILPTSAYSPDVEGKTALSVTYLESKSSDYHTPPFHPPTVIFA